MSSRAVRPQDRRLAGPARRSPSQRQYLGESALRIPRVAGRDAGPVLGDLRRVARVAVVAGHRLQELAEQHVLALRRLAVSRPASRSCSSRCAGRCRRPSERSPAASRATNSWLTGAATGAGEVVEMRRPVERSSRRSRTGSTGSMKVRLGDGALEREGGDRGAAGRPADEVRRGGDAQRREQRERCRRPSRAARAWRRSAPARCPRTRACPAPAGGSARARRRTGAR